MLQFFADVRTTDEVARLVETSAAPTPTPTPA